MRNFTLLACLLIAGSECFCQIKFENGYFIGNDGRKVECLIRNGEWKNNPDEVIYKETPDSEAKTLGIGDVTEFGVPALFKYKRFEVDVDESKDDLSQLTYNQYPEFSRRRLLLKVLVEGKAVLYSYDARQFVRFFFSTDSLPAQQLVYKKYLVSPGVSAETQTFRNQLWNALKCPAIKLDDLKKIKYVKKELAGLFQTYNACRNPELAHPAEKKRRDFFNLTIRPGINVSSFGLKNTMLGEVFDFGTKPSLRLGLEAEFVIGLNRNKWAFLVEPAYKHYRSEIVANGRKAGMDYQAVEVSSGVRHYFFLNDNSKIFVNAGFLYDIPINTALRMERRSDLLIRPGLTGVFGLGYKHAGRYSVEARGTLPGNILDNYAFWESRFQTFSLVLGYTLF